MQQISVNSFNFTKEELEYLNREIDFYSTVKQLSFKELSEYVNTGEDIKRDKLIEISKHYDLYHSYVAVPRRNILEVKEDFNLEIPFNFF